MSKSEEAPSNTPYFKLDRYSVAMWMILTLTFAVITWNTPVLIEFWRAATESFVGYVLVSAVRFVVVVGLALWLARPLRRHFTK